MTTLHISGKTEKRFMDYLIKRQWGPYPVDTLSEASALFSCIQHCFNGSGAGKFLETDQYLVHNLAACTLVAMEYNVGDLIPWDTGWHDDIFTRTLRGFIFSLIKNIKNGRIKQDKDGEWRANGFIIPDWFAELALSSRL